MNDRSPLPEAVAVPTLGYSALRPRSESLTALAVLHQLFAAPILIPGVIAAAIVIGIVVENVLARLNGSHAEWRGVASLLIGFCIAASVITVGCVIYDSGRCIWGRRRRRFSVCVAALMLLLFLLGTILGLATLIVLRKPSIIEEYSFSQADYGRS